MPKLRNQTRLNVPITRKAERPGGVKVNFDYEPYDNRDSPEYKALCKNVLKFVTDRGPVTMAAVQTFMQTRRFSAFDVVNTLTIDHQVQSSGVSVTYVEAVSPKERRRRLMRSRHAKVVGFNGRPSDDLTDSE